MHTVDMGDIYTGVEELVGESVARHIAVAGDESISRDVRIHTKLVPDLDLLAGGISADYCEAVVRRSRNRTGVPTLVRVVSRSISPRRRSIRFRLALPARTMHPHGAYVW